MRAGAQVRIEVEDGGQHLPVLRPARLDATTGRGLSLVASVSARWGIEDLPGPGKRVWAELDPGGRRPGLPATPPDPLLSRREGDLQRLHVVCLGPVPTDLLIEAEAHIDGVVRELSLLEEGVAAGGAPLPSELAELVEPLTVDFADGRRQIVDQAAAAAARGEVLTDLELHLGPEAAEAGERLLAALDAADRWARAARLLALAAPPAHRVFRQWCVGNASAQLRALREGKTPPPTPPLAAALGEHLGRLAGMADAADRLTLIETVTTELATADTVAGMAEVVVDHAVRVLGVRSARVRVLTPHNTLRSVAWAGQATEPLIPTDSEIPLDADLPACRAARTGQSVYVRSIREAAGPFGDFELPTDMSARVLPLVVNGQVLGVLSLALDSSRLNNEAELPLTTALAGILARSINAPLRYESARGVVLDMAVHAAGVGTWDWDLITGQLVWDQQLMEIFGRLGDGTLTIEAFYSHLHPDDRDRVTAILNQVTATVGTYKAEYRIVLPDGQVRWVAAQGRALAGPDGTATRVLGVAQDTTERVEGRDRIARIMDAWATAFFFLDRSWRFTYLNAEAERVLGRRSDELVGQTIWEEFPAAVGSEFERWYRHGAQTGEEVAFDAYYPEPLNGWYEVRAWPGPDGLAVYFLDITARRQAEESAARAISRIGLLARVTEGLSSAAGTDSAIRTLAQLVVPTLAEWCVVTLNDDQAGGSRRGVTDSFGWHEQPELREQTQRYAAVRLTQMTDAAPLERALGSPETQVVDGNAVQRLQPLFAADSEAAVLLEQLDPDSVAVVPILGRHRPVGLLSACNGVARGSFSEVDIELLRDVAARAGVAIDRARLYSQQQEMAEALQRSMLTGPPQHGPRMAVRYVPAGEVAQVGGDWYDAFDHPDGARVVVIGDVVGHDTLAAAAMGQVRTLLRTVVARHGRSPAAALEEAEAVMGVLGVETLATVVVGRIECYDGTRCRMVMANAGHPAPFLVQANGDVTDLADGSTDPLIGIGRPSRHDSVVHLSAGSTLVLYTDGLVERRDRPVEDGRRLLARLLAGRAGADVEEMCDAVVEAMIDGKAEDDVALMAVRLPG